MILKIKGKIMNQKISNNNSQNINNNSKKNLRNSSRHLNCREEDLQFIKEQVFMLHLLW